jgi:SOUL heme-binding protein
VGTDREPGRTGALRRGGSSRRDEIRDYAPVIVAESRVAGTREAAINRDFRVIADDIFGNNAPAPPASETGEKIAMTAPVTQQGDGDG